MAALIENNDNEYILIMKGDGIGSTWFGRRQMIPCKWMESAPDRAARGSFGENGGRKEMERRNEPNTDVML